MAYDDKTKNNKENVRPLIDESDLDVFDKGASLIPLDGDSEDFKATITFINSTNLWLSLNERRIVKYDLMLLITLDMRKDLWMIASGARREMKNNPYYYQTLLTKYPQNAFSPYSYQIELDIERTYPDDTFFNDKSILMKLKNILIVYSRRNVTIGYAQGFNFIVGKLLKMYDYNEEETFWLFTQIIENLLPLGYFCNFTEMIADSRVVIGLLKKRFNEIYEHIVKLGCEIFLTNAIQKYLLSVFIQKIDESLWLIIWDRFMLEGSIALIKAIMALIELCFNDILQADNAFAIQEVLTFNKLIINEENTRAFIRIMNQYEFSIEKMNRKREKHLVKIFNEMKSSNIFYNNTSINNDDNKLKCNQSWPLCIKDNEYNHDLLKYIIYQQYPFPKINELYFDDEKHWTKEIIEENKKDNITFNDLLIQRRKHSCHIKSNLKNLFKELNKEHNASIQILMISNMSNGKETNIDSSSSQNLIDEAIINSLLSQFRLLGKYSLKASKDILQEITKDNNEKSLPLQSFIEAIVCERTILNESQYKEFYLQALQFFLTPSEQIKDILRQAKTKIQDTKLSEGISWAIESLSNTDIFDFRLKNDYSQSQLHEDEHVKFLSEYSYNMLKTKELQDLKKIEQPREERRRRSAMLSIQLPDSTNLVSKFNESLEAIKTIDFNIFEFKQLIGDSKLLYTVANYIFTEWDLFYVLTEEKFSPFIKAVNAKYNHNPYHNIIHATDILQTAAIILQFAKVNDRNLLDSLDISAVFVTCIIHDICHPGLSNQYQINKRTEMALLYNDKSPLENMHCYEGFKVLLATETNILEDLSKEEVNVFRRRVIDAILSTDGSNHFKIFNLMKGKVDQAFQDSTTDSTNLLERIILNDDKNKQFEQQQDFINFAVHAADISNPTKNFEDVYSKWTEYVMTEFYNEGDLERKEKLPINFLCDRETIIIPKAQIGFIGSIVMPTFKILIQAIPELKPYEDNMTRNISQFQKQLETEENKTINN